MEESLMNKQDKLKKKIDTITHFGNLCKRREESRCICVRECDCEHPEPLSGAALVSHECPEHNDTQKPHPECRAEKHWFE